MRRFVFPALLFVFGCGPEKGPTTPEAAPVRDRLPLHDRDLLLEPLILSLDDLRESIDNDASLETYERKRADNRVRLEARFRTHGADTLAILALAESDGFEEEFAFYFRDHGNLFYLYHRLEGGPCNVFADSCLREERIYFEGSGNLLAAFQRYSEGSDKMSAFSTFSPSEGYLQELVGSRGRFTAEH